MWLISTNSIVSGKPSIACPMHAAPGPMNGMGSLWSVQPLRKGSVTDLLRISVMLNTKFVNMRSGTDGSAAARTGIGRLRSLRFRQLGESTQG